jgi:hypothetical protein
MPIPRAYRNNPDAPWNDDPCPECPECDAVVHDVDSHEDWCPEPLGQEELAERLDERNRPEYDPVEHKHDL